MFLTYLYVILVVVLPNSNSKLNANSAISTYQLVEELFDAFDRKDYVDLWIKLIDLKLQLNPPDKFSTEMINLLKLRRRLVKLHKYYLKMFRKKAPSKNFTSDYDSNWLMEQDLTSILNVFNVVEQEINTLVDDNPVSDDQISSMFNFIASNLIKTTEDVFSTNIPEVGKDEGYVTDVGVSNEKPLLGASPNNVQFSEETNNAISESMLQLSNLIESAPHSDQSNLIAVTTTTASYSDADSTDTALNDTIGNLFSIFNVLANSIEIPPMNNTNE